MLRRTTLISLLVVMLSSPVLVTASWLSFPPPDVAPIQLATAWLPAESSGRCGLAYSLPGIPARLGPIYDPAGIVERYGPIYDPAGITKCLGPIYDPAGIAEYLGSIDNSDEVLER